MYTETLCLGCMERKGISEFCPHCGWKKGALPESPLYLAPGTVLNDQYLVGKVLGHGGFGITYLGWDLNLNTKVAIKEYLPGALATRHPGSSEVTVYSGDTRGHFDYGLEKFIEEARALARFQNQPGIVSVVNFFRANETGYIVMTYLDGLTFKDYLYRNGGRVTFEAACSILSPVMDALREVHAAGMLHRDISPDNIYITNSNQVKLLDFGAAKCAIGEQSQSLAVILKPGYAPEEQYRSRGNQGPWTDVYALAATMYCAVTGHPPPDALDRLERDEIRPPSVLGVLMPQGAEPALMKALAVRATNRFQDVATFQNSISQATIPVTEIVTAPDRSADALEKLRRAGSSLVRWRVAAAILLIATMISLTGWIVMTSQLASKLDSAKYEAGRLERLLDSEKAAKRELMEKHAARQLTIKSIRLQNEDKDGKSLDFLSSLTRRFKRESVRYIAFELEVQNNWLGMKDIEGDLGIKYFHPDGKLKEGEKSRDGYTFSKTAKIKDKGKITGGWGNPDGGSYRAGTHRIEFWWAGEKIGQVSFEIYE